MRKGRFSKEQIIKVLKEQQAGIPVVELCRKHGISDATFYTWRSKRMAGRLSGRKPQPAVSTATTDHKTAGSTPICVAAAVKPSLCRGCAAPTNVIFTTRVARRAQRRGYGGVEACLGRGRFFLRRETMSTPARRPPCRL